MSRKLFASVALVSLVALVGCGSTGSNAKETAQDTSKVNSDTQSSAPDEPRLTLADALAVVPSLPGATWTAVSQISAGSDPDYSAGGIVDLLSSDGSSLSDPCEQYKWAANVVSGSDVGNSDKLAALGALVDSETTLDVASNFASVFAREFPSSKDANLWLDGFVSTAQACPGTDSFGTDYGMGWNVVSVADRSLSSGARLVESAAVGESDEAGQGTFTAAVAVENIVVVVFFKRHSSGEPALESTSGSDLATFYAGALH